jgi:uncharacterized phage protein gp47/JayE
MTTNVPSLTWANTGLVAPAETDIVAGLWADYQAAFGGNLNTSPATPQGQLVTAQAAILGAVNDLVLEIVNQIDPAFADGRMQDAIARIYYLSRITGQSTTVVCTCTGLAGTVIPAGSLAQATDGNIYQSVAAATIPTGGSVSVTFQAINQGPIVCSAGTLNRIYRVVSGWDSITNPADGIVGREAESRTSFEARRAASVAGNATGILGAVRGAVLGVSGVVDAYVIENSTGSAVTVGGVSIAARSIYVCAYGGADADVARAIWSKKPPGCGYTGSTSVTVTDSGSGYTPPYPFYAVSFQRPTALPIYLAVSIANGASVPSDAVAQVQNAIIAAFAGADGGPAAKIGGTVYALRFSTALAALGSWVQLISIAIGTTSSPSATSVIANINQIPTVSAANIAVTLV